ncbi:DUF368 domain-containing protein [Fusobacterium sp. SYSU M8D902]|uniref:DUF368 domain-containing protein n=1 Tax=Fusobacterium sp. SYSU M8D902 TaxID=3159562 RepID=UPI0032E44B41
MIQLFLKGIIIGIANIMPGVSGGTLAVILGVYDRLTEAIGNFPTAPTKKKIEYAKFLLQIGVGAVVGVVLFARIIEFCFTNYPRLTAGGFSLLIIPSIPYIIKGEDKRAKKNIVAFILGAILTLCFVYADYKFGKDGGSRELVTVVTTAYAIKLFVCGGVAAGAMIIPGISGSLLLLMLGEYYNILGFINKFFSNLINITSYSSIGEIVTNLYIIPLTAFGVGVVLGLVLIAKLINMLLARYRSVTLFFITGIVMVSVLQIWVNLYK